MNNYCNRNLLHIITDINFLNLLNIFLLLKIVSLILNFSNKTLVHLFNDINVLI